MSTRNKIDTNTRFFKIIKSHMRTLDYEFEINYSKSRYIKTDKPEQTWLTKTQILSSLELTPYFKFAIIEHDSIEYFISIGDSLIEPDDEIFSPIELNSSLFTLLVPELDIKIKLETKAIELYEYALFDIEEKQVIGYDYQKILNFFPTISIYSIADDKLPANSKLEVLCFHFCLGQDRFNSLNLSQNVKELYSKIIFEHSECINIIDLLHGFISYNWKHSFLENYRLFESFFKYPALYDIFNQLGIDNLSFKDFIHKMQTLRWKEKEDIAINRLFNYVGQEEKEGLRIIKSAIFSSSEGEIDSFFYKLRNSIVHNRSLGNSISLGEKDWQKLLEISLKINLTLLNRF